MQIYNMKFKTNTTIDLKTLNALQIAIFKHLCYINK